MTSRLARYPRHSDALKLDSFPNHTENNTWKACGTHAGISGSLHAMWLQESSDILLIQMRASARTRGIGHARALQIIFLGTLLWGVMDTVIYISEVGGVSPTGKSFRFVRRAVEWPST